MTFAPVPRSCANRVSRAIDSEQAFIGYLTRYREAKILA